MKSKRYYFFLYLMAVLYIAAGINHFLNPLWYIKIIPSYLPKPDLLNYASGFFELIFGSLLIFKKTRRLAAWGIILLLIAVFPANINMCISYYVSSNPKAWITILRLPLQLLLIWWAWVYARQEKIILECL